MAEITALDNVVDVNDPPFWFNSLVEALADGNLISHRERFAIPSGASPRPERLLTVNPADKYNRQTGMTSLQSSQFARVCTLGTDTIIGCYKDCDCEYSPHDVWVMCGSCKYRREEYRDPWYDNIFDGYYLERYYSKLMCDNSEKPKAYVYFISDSQFVKIGSAADPFKRLVGIQTGNPRKVTLLYTLPCKTRDDASQLENELHQLYENYRLKGEWFDILPKIYKKTFTNRYSPKRWFGKRGEWMWEGE